MRGAQNPAAMCTLVFCLALSAAAQTFTPTHYNLQWRIQPDKERVDGRVRVSFINSGAQPAPRIEFLLYRLLKVTAVQNDKGQALTFTQQILSMPEEENWQVNHVAVQLPAPVPPGGKGVIAVDYGGGVFGYREVMAYTRERISEDYALFRPESIPYPMLGEASEAVWRRFFSAPITFNATITVPKDMIVVCADQQAVAKLTDGQAEFVCSRTRPAEQLNIAIAKFQVLRDDAEGIAVYALPAEAQAAPGLLAEMKRARDFFSSYFGKLESAAGVNLIELPDGWGSYTGSGFIFQTAAAFKDPNSIPELYHEVAHAWNAQAKPQVQRARWFDEAFASYFEALAVRSFQGEKAYRDNLESTRKFFLRRAAKDRQALDVPIADYGKYEIGRYSYTKGAWSLYVLHEVLGEVVFRRAISQFLSDYRTMPADFADFRKSVETSCRCDLQRYFDEWIFGTESSRLLSDDVPIEQIAARYRAAWPQAAQPEQPPPRAPRSPATDH